jgi:hypothetical protein
MADQSVMDTPIFDALLSELGLEVKTEVTATDERTPTSNNTARPDANPVPKAG